MAADLWQWDWSVGAGRSLRSQETLRPGIQAHGGEARADAGDDGGDPGVVAGDEPGERRQDPEEQRGGGSELAGHADALGDLDEAGDGGDDDDAEENG